MQIINIMYQGKEMPIYTSQITPEEKAMSAVKFDKKIKKDFCAAMNTKSSNHVCSYMYKGCVFAWESISEDEMVDEKFALSLNLPALRAIVMDTEIKTPLAG